MAMRAYIAVPRGGLNIDGIAWPEGPREITDQGWYSLLKSRGAVDISEGDYENWKKYSKGKSRVKPVEEEWPDGKEEAVAKTAVVDEGSGVTVPEPTEAEMVAGEEDDNGERTDDAGGGESEAPAPARRNGPRSRNRRN